jgi:hypothetical protein
MHGSDRFLQMAGGSRNCQTAAGRVDPTDGAGQESKNVPQVDCPQLRRLGLRNQLGVELGGIVLRVNRDPMNEYLALGAAFGRALPEPDRHAVDFGHLIG